MSRFKRLLTVVTMIISTSAITMDDETLENPTQEVPLDDKENAPDGNEKEEDARIRRKIIRQPKFYSLPAQGDPNINQN